MACQLPFWLLVAQALSVPIVAATAAALAAWIGHRQWRTSHQKLLLDLFDKRWEVANEIRTLMGQLPRDSF